MNLLPLLNVCFSRKYRAFGCSLCGQLSIERLWKHVKNRLRTKYYDDFNAFQKTIDAIVYNTDKYDNSIINKLIGEKVQLFADSSGSCKLSESSCGLIRKAD